MQNTRRALTALAVVAALGLSAAACGNSDDDSSAVRTEVRAYGDEHRESAAFDQQRANEAASARLAGEAERQAHLDANAELYGNLSANAADGLTQEQSAAQAASAPTTDNGYVDPRADDANAVGASFVNRVGAIFTWS